MVLANLIDLTNPMNIISLVLALIIAICLIVFLATKTNRKFTLIFYPITFVFLFTS